MHTAVSTAASARTHAAITVQMHYCTKRMNKPTGQGPELVQDFQQNKFAIFLNQNIWRMGMMMI
jgi:hypothetical protein